MVVYNLPSNPNFTMSISPEGQPYNLHFQHIRGLMYVTIDDRYGNRMAGPRRVCNGQWLIGESARNHEGAGNIVVVMDGDDYPEFANFSSCQMRYYTLAEIEEGAV